MKQKNEKINANGIKSLVIEDFHLINSFEMLKNSLLFFYIGNLVILNKS